MCNLSRVALHEFQVSSVVPASPAEVWARVSSIEGINHELMPLARMTCPRRFAAIDPAVVPLGERLFRSWILLFGVLPVDYDDLTLVRVEPGRGFLETSRMLSQRRWVHERTLEAVPGGCRVTDRIGFEPRLAPAAGVFRRVFRLFFAHRHRRLGAFFARKDR